MLSDYRTRVVLLYIFSSHSLLLSYLTYITLVTCVRELWRGQYQREISKNRSIYISFIFPPSSVCPLTIKTERRIMKSTCVFSWLYLRVFVPHSLRLSSLREPSFSSYAIFQSSSCDLFILLLLLLVLVAAVLCNAGWASGHRCLVTYKRSLRSRRSSVSLSYGCLRPRLRSVCKATQRSGNDGVGALSNDKDQCPKPFWVSVFSALPFRVALYCCRVIHSLHDPAPPCPPPTHTNP